MSTRAYIPSPETNERIIKEIVDDYEIPAIRDALKQIHDEGYIIFGKAKPAQQLQAYLDSTLFTEIEMLMDPLYLDLVEAGIYPPPQPQVWIVVDQTGQKVVARDMTGRNMGGPYATEQEALVAAFSLGLLTPELIAAYNAMQDGMADPMMQLPPLPVQAVPSFWSQVYALGRYDNESPFEWEIKDFTRLLNTLNRRIDKKVAL